VSFRKLAQGFEFADVGPNAGESAYSDGPAVWRPRGGRLMKRSEYEDKDNKDEIAPGLNPQAVSGVAREPEEKVSGYDDTLFSGDPTQLMPHLRQIHKMGQATSGTIGIEDIDAIHQSTQREHPRQMASAMTDRAADAGPGYSADNSSLGIAPSEPEGDGHGDIPIEEPTGQTSTREVFKRNVQGFSKSAAGLLDLLGLGSSDVMQSELLPRFPRPETVSREQQRALLERALYDAQMGLRGRREPAAISIAGDKILEGAQYSRLANSELDSVNRDLALRALEKGGMAKCAEPPPPPGMSAARWDKILEAGPKQGEEVLPPILAEMENKQPVIEVTDLIKRLEKRGYELQGHTEVQGIPIAIENRAGSVRSGKTEDGHEWRTKMKFPYGYIKGTKGADGDPVDVYVGPEKEAPAAFVVHQHKVDGTGYDEDKVMLGFPDKRSAKEAYLAHYDDPKFLGPIAKVSVDRLRELVASKKRLVKISRASWNALLQELQKLGQEEGALPAPQEPQEGRLKGLVRKAGPGIGGALGAGVGALVGLKRGKLLSSTLTGLGTGATLGWTPDLYHSAREAIQKYRSGQ